MMTYFSFAIKDNKNCKEESKKKKDSSFDNIFKIFSIINERNLNWKKELDNLFKNYEDSDFSFITWAINHYLVYNKFLRDNAELFFNTKDFLKDKKYTYFFVDFCIKNKIKFPKYMQWYKSDTNNDPKKFMDFFKETFKLKDEEIEEFLNYMTNKGISFREICLNLNYLIN